MKTETTEIEFPFDKSARAADRILRLPAIKARTGRSRSSIYADAKIGRFPPSIAIGPHAVGWLESEIDEWLAARIAESRGRSR